mgnify:CR=1 FL=1
MSLICFKNGSLARERVRDAFGYDWKEFSAALRRTPPGNHGRILLPYFEPEIVPRVAVAGIRRKGLDENDADANCRAVVEAQMMSMRLHSAWMGSRPREIYATGGASANREILQVMADVHGCPVTRFRAGNSAALGAALRAAHAFAAASGETCDWKTLTAPFLDPDPELAANPQTESAAVYEDLVRAYADFEQEALA